MSFFLRVTPLHKHLPQASAIVQLDRGFVCGKLSFCRETFINIAIERRIAQWMSIDELSMPGSSVHRGCIGLAAPLRSPQATILGVTIILERRVIVELSPISKHILGGRSTACAFCSRRLMLGRSDVQETERGGG